MNTIKKCLMALIFLISIPFSTAAEEITVAAAANVQFTLEEIAVAFKKETGIDVKPIIGSSGNLTAQIENGAPFDIFMSADMDYPTRLFKDGLALSEPQIYAYGILVLWTFQNIDLSRGVAVLNDNAVKKIAIASPQVAPYGRQAVNAMKYNHLYPAIESKLVYGENIAQVNQFVTTGAVDVGITAKSVVLADNMKDKGQWVEVDSKSYEPIAQGVVILKYAQKEHLKASRQFYDFLFSDEVKEILQKYGYQLP